MRLRLPCAATIAAILLVSQAAHAGVLFPRVVVVVAPVKPYVDEILHGLGESTSLLRPGQEPHEFALTIPQAEMLEKADVIIVPDLGINPFLKRVLAKNKHAHIIELTQLEGAETLPFPTENPFYDDIRKAVDAAGKTKAEIHHTGSKLPVTGTEIKPETKKKDDETPKNDPHIWLDPGRMAAVSVPLAEAIAEQAPESKATLVNNARNLSTHLTREVIPAMRTMLNRTPMTTDAMQRPEIPYITSHAAYRYFYDRFKLKLYGEIAIKPEESLGGKTLSTLITGAQGVHLHCIIAEQDNALVKRLALVSSAEIVTLSPEQIPDKRTVDVLDWIRTDYDRFLYVTAKAFGHCLSPLGN